MKNTPARRPEGQGDDSERPEGAQLHDGVCTNVSRLQASIRVQNLKLEHDQHTPANLNEGSQVNRTRPCPEVQPGRRTLLSGCPNLKGRFMARSFIQSTSICTFIGYFLWARIQGCVGARGYSYSTE